MQRKHSVLLIVLASGAAATFAACTTQLGSLGIASVAYDINDTGVAVGDSFVDGITRKHAVMYPPGGDIVDLGTLDGDAFAGADAIADDGTIVGWSGNGDAMDQFGVPGLDRCTNCRVALWDVNGQIHDLGQFAPGVSTRATDINASGFIVGFAAAPGGEQPWLRDPVSGVMTALPLLSGALGGQVLAINDVGEAAGFVWLRTSPTSAPSKRAVRWDTRTGTITDLTPADVGDAEAHGINAAGTVIGFVRKPGTVLGAVWPKGSNETSPIYLSRGTGTASLALSINDQGTIVGQVLRMTIKGTYWTMAARWRPVSGATAYSEPFMYLGDWTSEANSAYSINDAGVVVGFAKLMATRFE